MPDTPRLDERTLRLAKSYAKLKSMAAVGAAENPPVTREAVRQTLQEAYDAGLLKPPAFLVKRRRGGQTPVRVKVAEHRARKAAERVCRTCAIKGDANPAAKWQVDCQQCIDDRIATIVRLLAQPMTTKAVASEVGVSQQYVSKIARAHQAELVPVFGEGDVVRWTTHRRTTLSGTIVGVVKPGKLPKLDGALASFVSGFGPGGARKVKSYVVAVPAASPGRKGTLYWPPPQSLRPAPQAP